MAEFQRSGRRIKPNHSGALPRYILSIHVDTRREYDPRNTDNFSDYWRSGTIVYGRLSRGKIGLRSVETFTERERFWARIYYATGHRHTTWVIGQGILAQLILAGLPHRFQCGELSIDRPRSIRVKVDENGKEKDNGALAVLESPPTIIGCRVGETQGRLVIVDILNWFPQGIPTDEATQESWQLAAYPEGNRNDRKRPIGERIAFDVHTTFEQLISWVSDNDMGLFRYTASSQAMGAYRHRFMEHPIYVHDNSPIQKLERRAYFGGRSDMFRCGPFKGPHYQVDCNALFPAVMQTGAFPHYLSRSEQRAEMLELLPSIDWSASVATVEICTSKPLYPLRTDLHILYPVGRFITTLCGEELYRAFRNGLICKCGSWAEYKLKPLFTNWVTELWAMRQRYKAEGNELYEKFTKFTMNSLYGKFAQLTPSWINVSSDYSILPFTTDTRYDFRTGQYTTYRAVGWQVQRFAERMERANSFYAVPAFVTAAARCRMDSIRAIAGRENVYYQGVDSVIVNRFGYHNLEDAGQIDRSQLGKLRLEHTAAVGEIRGISDYELGDKVVLSSRSLNSETNSLGEVMQHKRYIMQHLFRNGPIDHVEERLEQWRRMSKYAKGDVQPDGWVAPFELGAELSPATIGSSPDLEAASAS